MKKVAVDKARNRLERAKQAIDSLGPTATFAEFSNVWTDFLIYLNGVRIALEQASKDTPDSRQWFNAKKSVARNDPLLKYLYQARNSEEHGIDPVLSTRLGISVNNTTNHEVKLDFNNARFENGVLSVRLESKSGIVPEMKMIGPFISLVPIRDGRSGAVFPVPEEHLNSPIASSSPLAIADLGIAYYTTLLDEAVNMI